MGVGRRFSRALKSNVTPTGRWAPPPNARARCMGNEMFILGKPGTAMGVRKNFLEASGKCKIKGK